MIGREAQLKIPVSAADCAVVYRVDDGFLFFRGKNGHHHTFRGSKTQQGTCQRVPDGAYAFSVSALEAVKLKTGQHLSDAQVAALQAEDEVGKAVDSAARFLSYRPRSTEEIRRNLAEKSIPEPVIAQALVRLEQLGVLDDVAFARFWVQARTTAKPMGTTALRYELRQKGLSDETIDEALEPLDNADEAYKAARARAAKWRGTDRRTFRTKLTGFLQRRGFDYGAVRDALERLMDELDEADDGFFASDDTP